jgi:hypothetical protein
MSEPTRIKREDARALGLDLPRDTYNVLLVTLPSERRLAVLVPSGIDEPDTRHAHAELISLAGVIESWLVDGER